MLLEGSNDEDQAARGRPLAGDVRNLTFRDTQFGVPSFAGRSKTPGDSSGEVENFNRSVANGRFKNRRVDIGF